MMVMKKTTSALALRSRRVGVAEAKAHLSEVLRSLDAGPIVIHARGRDVGALVDIDTYERLTANDQTGVVAGGATFLESVEELKKRHGGGAPDFDPAPAVIRPQNPFRSRRRR
jgi:prevent-host-death family protein